MKAVYRRHGPDRRGGGKGLLVVGAHPNPYMDYPPEAFWRKAVAERGPLGLEGVWRPRFPISPGDRMVTFGSCFAQHIGRALKARGYAWYDAERAPDTFTAEDMRRFNYGVFSARTGNIYTTAMLLQWTRWALGRARPPKEIWEEGGRFHDPFRPRIEPNGFASRDEMLKSLHRAIASFRECIMKARVFVFTLGLTESWTHASRQWEYPVCPGTVAGTYLPEQHRFVNHDYAAVLASLAHAIDLISEANPRMRFILTISPVPLAATASGDHVLVATTASKAILRAVAASLVASRKNVDYFPAYELIASPVARGMFFAPDQRTVVAQGVDYVMDHFFRPLTPVSGANGGNSAPAAGLEPADPRDVVCEEELLDAFGG